ncbi:MAG: hypothetical protein HRU19_16775 [Pseudobacteriovorax sp.]|nr:hypothetical protein [Pseudobacteriovorax sp.]
MFKLLPISSLMVASLILTSCASMPKLGSKPEFTSNIIDQQRTYKSFKVDNYTDAPLRIVKKVHFPFSASEAHKILNLKIPTWFESIPKVEYFRNNRKLSASQIKSGSERVCAFGDDRLVEEIIQWKPGKFVAYRIDGKKSNLSLPIKDHLAMMNIEDDGKGGSLLTWRTYYNKKFHIMAPIVTMGLSSQMDDALTNLTEKYGGTLLSL